jgi:hypothetical protein
MEVRIHMIWPRRACLALFLIGISGCGSWSSDPSKLPPDDPAIRGRSEQIDRFKARTTRPVNKPGR